ncbi:hypothetical protein DFJ74DRAFT_707459 [Hyaloraphidium curvatum]|nr:hypothetical protein DFJ74DRAFT_707459 [Hyaloraphidium curvatum]
MPPRSMPKPSASAKKRLEGNAALEKGKRQCVCRSAKERSAADRLMREIFVEAESPDIELVWTALDTYTYSVLLARDRDTESEAIACSKIGYIYRNVFKSDAAAEKYYRLALDLAKSMMPRSFAREAWYQETTAAVQAFRDSKQRAEQAEHDEKRAPFLAELTIELDELKAAAASEKSAQSLIEHVYGKHPPARDGCTMPKVGTGEGEVPIKKALMVAITHYHPDRNLVPEKWKVLCEEITKVLTHRYETFK